MAVVTKYASGAFDPSVQPVVPLPAEETEGHVKSLTSTVELASGNSIGSKIYFGRLPSTCRLQRGSFVLNDALTSLTDFDLGGYRTIAGVSTIIGNGNELVDGANLATAGTSQSAVANVDIANMNKPLYQLLGLTDDPGGEIDIVGILNTAAGAAGTITLQMHFCTP